MSAEKHTLVAMPRIYCDDCDEIRPLLVDHLRANALNDHAVQDLICGECHLIIATLHGAAPAAVEGAPEG